MGGPEGEASEQGIEILFEEIIAENIPNIVKKKITQVQKAQKAPIKMNPRKPTQMEMAKGKDRES